MSSSGCPSVCQASPAQTIRVKDLYARAVSRIIIKELAGIRNGDDHHGRQVNAMIHNCWSQRHVADRLTWAAEEYGIKVETISEAYTSQTCPRCGSEAYRDAVGVLNTAARCGERAVRPMVWPMLLRWDGCGWNRNNGMSTLERSRVEA